MLEVESMVVMWQLSTLSVIPAILPDIHSNSKRKKKTHEKQPFCDKAHSVRVDNQEEHVRYLLLVILSFLLSYTAVLSVFLQCRYRVSGHGGSKGSQYRGRVPSRMQFAMRSNSGRQQSTCVTLVG